MTNMKTALILFCSMLLLSILINTKGNAGGYHGHESGGWGGTVHGHGGYRGGYGPGPRYGGGYYNRGGFAFGWGGPNVIVNVPAVPYYVPQCDNMEVCNSYGECWIEQYCN